MIRGRFRGCFRGLFRGSLRGGFRAWLASWRRGGASRSSPHLALGARGERLAAGYLRRRGYRILDRNVRLGVDEADLIVRDPEDRFLVIVEVKTRRSDATDPAEHVSRTKQFRLARLAARLLRQPAYRDAAIRFDVVAVTLPDDGEPRIQHWTGAFEAPF